MIFTKSTIILMLLGVIAVLGAPQGDLQTPIAILEDSRDGPNADGSYKWSYKTANDIQAEEQGSIVASRDNNNNEGALLVQGRYSFITPEGIPIQMEYISDENGFQPKGDHLPVAPAIPPAILKALEWIAAHPEEDNL